MNFDFMHEALFFFFFLNEAQKRELYRTVATLADLHTNVLFMSHPSYFNITDWKTSAFIDFSCERLDSGFHVVKRFGGKGHWYIHVASSSMQSPSWRPSKN